jgi:hypothetical protein
MEDLESWPFFAAAMAAERRELKVGLGPWTIGYPPRENVSFSFSFADWMASVGAVVVEWSEYGRSRHRRKSKEKKGEYGRYIRRTAMMMSEESCVLSLLVRASVLALSCLILDQRLWPECT